MKAQHKRLVFEHSRVKTKHFGIPSVHPRFFTGDQARSHGGHLGVNARPNFVVPRKICFEHLIKNKNIVPLKCIWIPHTLKPGIPSVKIQISHWGPRYEPQFQKVS